MSVRYSAISGQAGRGRLDGFTLVIGTLGRRKRVSLGEDELDHWTIHMYWIHSYANLESKPVVQLELDLLETLLIAL